MCIRIFAVTIIFVFGPIAYVLIILNQIVSFTQHVTVHCPMQMCEIDRETNTSTIQSLVFTASDIMAVRDERVSARRERDSIHVIKH